MHLKEGQKLQVRRFESGARVSGLGTLLISTIIMGFALIIITTVASVLLLIKNLIK